MRDMDSGTKSQLRRLYNAVRRAYPRRKTSASMSSSCCARAWPTPSRATACAAWTRSRKLLLQVTRKNDARGYERFKDLFEAIVAYNE